MEAMREAWTDDRLDDLNRKVDDGFLRVDKRFDTVDKRFDKVDSRIDRIETRLDRIDARFEKVDARFQRLESTLDERLYSIQRTMVFGVLALSGAFMAGFAGLIGLFATQL